MSLQAALDQLPSLDMDSSYRGDCPICGGRNTFTVSRNIGGIIYNCYKNTCKLSGKSDRPITIADLSNMKESKAHNNAAFNEPTHWVRSHPAMNEWMLQYDLNARHIDTRYDVKEDRVVFLVKKDRKIVDATGRVVGGNTYAPKWKRYGEAQVPYVYGEGEVAVVVEDCVSASVVGEMENLVGFGLLGTNLLAQYVDYLKPYSKIIVALDPDAKRKTLQITSTLRSTFPNVYALNLQDDIKYRMPSDMAYLRKFAG